MARNHLADKSPWGPLAGALGKRQWLGIVILIAGTELVTLTLTAGSHPAPGQHLVLGLIVCGGPIVLLRRWPLPGLALATAATAVVMTWGNAPLPFGIMIGLAMYAAASRLPRRVSIPAAVAAATALAGVIIYEAIVSRSAPVAVGAVEGFVPLVAAWFIGDSVAGPPPLPGRAWPSRRNASGRPRPSAPASRSARNGSASPTSCTTSSPTPSR